MEIQRLLSNNIQRIQAERKALNYTCFEFVAAVWAANRNGQSINRLAQSLRRSNDYVAINRDQIAALPNFSVIAQKDRPENFVTHVVLLYREGAAAYIFEKLTYGVVRKIPLSEWHTFGGENPYLYALLPGKIVEMMAQ